MCKLVECRKCSSWNLLRLWRLSIPAAHSLMEIDAGEPHFLKGSNDKSRSFLGRLLSVRLPWWPMESQRYLRHQGLNCRLFEACLCWGGSADAMHTENLKCQSSIYSSQKLEIKQGERTSVSSVRCMSNVRSHSNILKHVSLWCLLYGTHMFVIWNLLWETLRGPHRTLENQDPRTPYKYV